MSLKRKIIREAVISGVGLVAAAVSMILSAAHTKEDLIRIRREKWEKWKDAAGDAPSDDFDAVVFADAFGDDEVGGDVTLDVDGGEGHVEQPVEPADGAHEVDGEAEDAQEGRPEDDAPAGDAGRGHVDEGGDQDQEDDGPEA